MSGDRLGAAHESFVRKVAERPLHFAGMISVSTSADRRSIVFESAYDQLTLAPTAFLFRMAVYAVCAATRFPRAANVARRTHTRVG